MITSIIFSKDRALQLDLTLKSVKQNFPLCGNIEVIYKCSSDDHNNSYEKLKIEHPDVGFRNQKHDSLIWIIVKTIDDHTGDYFCFLTDDDIFYRKSNTTKSDLINLLGGPACISLRMGVNITHRDFGNGLEPDTKPDIFKYGNNHIVWNRMTVPAGGYWNYPLSVDGHIFKQDLILKILYTMNKWPESSTIFTPNKFEQMLQRFFFDISSTMASEIYSCVVNSPNNRVQNEFDNKHGEKFFCDAESLNFVFNQGKRIDLNKLEFGQICCPHQEINLSKGWI